MSNPRERFLLALDLFTAEAEAAAPHLGLQSACDDWSVADVIRHVTGVQSEHSGAALVGQAMGASSLAAEHQSVMAPGSDLGSVEAWTQLASILRRAAGPADDAAFAALPLATLDMALHAWDVRWGAARVGLADTLVFPEALLDWMEEYRDRANEEAIRQPGIFGEPIAAPDDASRTERFVAWTGRDPRVERP